MATFNPLQNFGQGVALAGNIQQQQKQNQINALQQGLLGQIQQGGFDPASSNDLMQLGVLDPTKGRLAAENIKSLVDDRKRANFEDARAGLQLLESKNYQGFLDLSANRINAIESTGGDSSDTRYLLDLFNSGEIGLLTDSLRGAVKTGVDSGYLKSTEPSELSQINLEKARIELENLRSQKPVSDKDFLKEERKFASDSIKNFNKRASEIRSSFGKVESILESGDLNRMKIASAMTSMARLLSPGIVTNQDFQNLSNSTNPVATLLSTLTGKGDDGAGVAAELQRYIDPTNPDLFDKQAFLTTAKNVVGAEVPSLIDTFNDSRDRALRANLSERAVNTNFGQNKNFTALQEMVVKSKPVLTHPSLGDVTEDQIQEAMKNKNMTRDQVLALLSGE